MTATNNKLVPHKRFPEYENSGDWEEKKLGDIGEIITGKTPSTSNKNLWKDEIHFVTPSDMKGTKYQYITERMVTNINIKLLPVGTVMFSCIATIGKIAIAKVVCTTNQQINSIIIDVEKINNEFVYYSLQSIISKIKAKYEKDAFSIINKTEFSNIIIQVSPLSAEQQKIADFLSSFDELIELEQKKLDKLKEYKKGLLQNLFPKENQKVPDLRFPEFKNSGEWVEKKIKDILDYEQPTNYIVESDNYFTYGTPVLTANKSFILGYTNEKTGIYNKLPVIIFDDFTTDKKYVSFPFKVKSSAIKILSVKHKKYNTKFIYELISLINFIPQEHKRNYISIYQNIDILIPSFNEQQKIADFLSAVDELIVEQINKIKELQEYKKGLLQQLFPN